MRPDVEAVDDLILGRGVKRGRHDLSPEVVQVFIERLASCGFAPSLVANVGIEVGVRVPAWLVRPPRVDFGTIFWEVFTDRKRRKIFGSEVRNAKGDWEIQLAASSPETVWVSLVRAESYDASRPVGMW
ncbi:MAG: hypothetical protein ACHQPI_09475 [Thermoanaerobaculia bacterium]